MPFPLLRSIPPRAREAPRVPMEPPNALTLPSNFFSGFFVLILITPPIALLPYRAELGPLTISIFSMSDGSRKFQFIVPPPALFIGTPSIRMRVRALPGRPRIVTLAPLENIPHGLFTCTLAMPSSKSSVLLAGRSSACFLVISAPLPGRREIFLLFRVAVMVTGSISTMMGVRKNVWSVMLVSTLILTI
ncbi:MAG: hypothetical protein C5S40_00575 [ANME-2 cluster archaeon]|nr:hypothetical protein [ANME-2 cluster archaeon]